MGDDNDNCCFCLEALAVRVDSGPVEDAIIRTQCNHSMHKTCLAQWHDEQASRSESATCPVCRFILGPAPPPRAPSDYDFMMREMLASSLATMALRVELRNIQRDLLVMSIHGRQADLLYPLSPDPDVDLQRRWLSVVAAWTVPRDTTGTIPFDRDTSMTRRPVVMDGIEWDDDTIPFIQLDTIHPTPPATAPAHRETWIPRHPAYTNRTHLRDVLPALFPRTLPTHRTRDGSSGPPPSSPNDEQRNRRAVQRAAEGPGERADNQRRRLRSRLARRGSP